MNRLVWTVVVAGTMILAACGGTEVAVQAQLEGQDGPVPLRELPIRALPYDRDAIFDSLRAEYAEPEPEIPADLMQLQDSIARAQETWRVAETRWLTVRDSLRGLRERLDGLSRASGQYITLFNQFNALDGQVGAAERQMNQSFERFQSLQNRFTAQAQEIKLARDQWADAAYADIDRIITARLRELRREERADTTNANGVARMRLAAGRWWIYARYDLPFEELYWNVPVEVERGEQTEVQLTRETAEVRPKL